jgi:hypothetical protein
MKHLLGLLILAGLPVCQIGLAQDTAAKKDLVVAIQKFSKKDVALSGSVKEEAQDKPGAGGVAGGIQRVIVSQLAGGSAESFKGDIEVLAYGNGDLTIASKEDLPGIKIFHSGDESIKQQTHLKAPFSSDEMITNMSKLLDWPSLAEAVDKATKVRTSTKGAASEVRVILEPSFIPVNESNRGIKGALGGAMAGGGAAGVGGAVGQNIKVQVSGGPMQSSVIELAATFTLSSAKEIVGMHFELQYDDPMKGMMAKAMKAGGGVIQIGGGKQDSAKEGPDLGKLVEYDFSIAAAPSPKVVEFSAQAKAMKKK